MITTSLLKQFVHLEPRWWPRRGQAARRQAIRQAYATFARQHWAWTGYLFDETFLTGPAFPLLARYLADQSLPQAAELVALWAEQVQWFNEETRRQHMEELTPVAADFLRLLRVELGVTDSLRA